MKFVRNLITVIALTTVVSLKAGSISSFHVQLELTPEAKAFVDALSDENKSNWLSIIPDSIPLKATCVLKMESQPSNTLHFKLGSIDGLNDVFEGSYDFTTSNTIEHLSSGNIHYFKLGNITHYKSFTALSWFSNELGAPIEMVRFVKQNNNQ